MSFLTIYQNFKRVFPKLWKNDVVNEHGNDLRDFVVTVDGNMIPRWIGSKDNLPSIRETDNENNSSVEAVS